ncbi:endogenous retrovirus group K member 113 Gag polyprotein-like [Numida meleagris]|uniref:endogenous retrovirus group K member 113 Gag polyprotein-like n=1 Tax=Numida meleagris TaxID=8996 RepID=UPI000B3DD64F|nr:endogenous retrovirus group K member 113 Gag polyprotein-like [Numida meleagris]
MPRHVKCSRGRLMTLRQPKPMERKRSEGEENKMGKLGEETGMEALLLAPSGAPRQGQATPGVQTSDDSQFWSMNPKGTLTCFPRAPVPSAPWPVQAGTPTFTVAPPPYGAAPRGAAAPGVGEGRMPRPTPVEQPLPSTSRRVTSSKDRVEGSQRRGADDETSSSGEEEGRLCIDLPSEGERRRRGQARDQVRRAAELWVIRAQECMLSRCELEPMPRSCYPVFVGGPQGPPWQPVDYKMLMQLRKAVQEGGLTGSQAQVPIFEAYIQEEVDSLRARAQADPAHPLHNIPANAITGKGNWSTPQEQLILPATVLVAAADLGRRALERMHTLTSGSPSYLNIRQKPGEHFGSFADQVQTAISRSNLPPETQEIVLRECLRSSAAPEYKAALAALPATATAGELIARGCAFGRAQEVQPLAAVLSEQVAGITAALQAMAVQTTPDVCFRCGKGRHLARNCSQGRGQTGGGSTTRCWVCGGEGHRAKDCTQKKTGASVTKEPSGNRKVGGDGGTDPSTTAMGPPDCQTKSTGVGHTVAWTRPGT